MPRDKEKEMERRRMTRREGTEHEGQLRAPRASLGTHGGAEGWHAAVAGGDGEVVEGDVLAVQLGVLPHPQLSFHRGDDKFPCRRQRGPGSHQAFVPQGKGLSGGWGTVAGLGTSPCSITAGTGGLTAGDSAGCTPR